MYLQARVLAKAFLKRSLKYIVMNLSILLITAPLWLSFIPMSGFQADFADLFTGNGNQVGSVSAEIVRILIALAMLTIVSVIDIKRRTVHDKVWIIFAIAGALIYIFDFPNVREAVIIGISIGFAAGISFATYRSGLFGGADALALITLSVILPIYTSGSNILHPIAPLTVLTNAAILSLLQVPVNVGRNISYIVTQKKGLFDEFNNETMARKTLAFLLGYRTTRVSRFAFSMEKNDKGKKEFDFSIKNAEKEEFCMRTDTWVTSATPFLLYIAAGTFTMVLLGDLLKAIFFYNFSFS